MNKLVSKLVLDVTLPWLRTGIWALALSGLYSIVLVMLRTPGVSDFFTDKSLFKSSLIIHVDLSVLVWLLSVTCVIWSCAAGYNYFLNITSKLAFISVFLIAISPVLSKSNPVMNNYIPILENLWFIIGLSLFGTSVLFFAIITLFFEAIQCWSILSNNSRDEYILCIVKMTSSLMYIMTWICFVLSYKAIMNLADISWIDIDRYYELLFWSGGHLMQFIYTQIVMFVWIVLGQFWVGKKLKYYNIYSGIFCINFIASILIFYGHYAYQISEYEFTIFFTKHMQYFGGLAPGLLAPVLILDIWRNYSPKETLGTKKKIPKFISSSLVASMLLFFAGGLMGLFISGVNVSVPAHYHGSIVGISIAFLGFAYMFCFDDCFEDSSSAQDLKIANIQIYLIAIGQLLHISGLALAGGYGVLRKNTEGITSTLAKVYMGMVGSGGLIAIIGGLIFIYICAKRLYYSSEESRKSNQIKS